MKSRKNNRNSVTQDVDFFPLPIPFKKPRRKKLLKHRWIEINCTTNRQITFLVNSSVGFIQRPQRTLWMISGCIHVRLRLDLTRSSDHSNISKSSPTASPIMYFHQSEYSPRIAYETKYNALKQVPSSRDKLKEGQISRELKNSYYSFLLLLCSF